MNRPTILVTGVTGFLGGATVARLLHAGPPGRLLLLVRGATDAEAAARVRRSLQRFSHFSEDDFAPCEIVRGDLTDRAVLTDPRFDAVTHALHLASNTSFRSVRGVRHANILGALTLAHRLRRAPALERFLYVGTAYLCGAEPPRVVHEDDYPQPCLRHLVEYTNSKAECEMLLENTAPELPLVVARPSVVVGHTRLGVRPSASIWWFYRTVALLQRTTFPLDSLDDVVPVDYVAEALLLLLFKADLRYRRYHLSTGAGSAVSWHEIAAAFGDCGILTDGTWRAVDFATIRAERGRMAACLGPGDESHMLDALEIYYRFGALNVEVFDNGRLLEEGIPPPPRFTDYLGLCASTSAGRSVYEQMRDDE